MSELTGQTAVVTGSSSGIGRAIAVELAAAGAAVLVHGRRSRQALEETAQAAAGRGVPVAIEMADIAEPEQHTQLVEHAWSWRGRIDIWVNNAGVDTSDRSGGRLVV